MKRFWLACFAVASVTSMVGTANAQYQSPEIGSYQSILSRTGYGASPVSTAVGSLPGSLPGQLVDMIPQAVAPVAPLGSSTRHAPVGSSTRQAAPIGSSTRSGAPVTSYATPATPYAAPVTSYAAPATSFAPQAVAGCSTCNGGGGVVGGGVVGGGSYGIPMAPSIGSAPVYGGGIVSGGSYTDLGAGCASGSCGAPVYTPGANLGGVGAAVGVGSIVDSAPNANTVNRVGGLFGVVFRRNFADRVRLGSNNGREIFSDDIDHGNISGLGVSLAARKANGNGREFVYWGLDDDIDITFSSPDFVSIRQLDDLRIGGATGLNGNTVLNYFNNANSLRIYRDTEINNIEANLLRNGGHYTNRRGKSGNFELLGGLRLFQFDESLRLAGFQNNGSNEYRLEAQNFLVGAQLGARNEVCLTKRFRLSTGINVGLFNNRSETRQRVFNQDGTNATVIGGPAAGRDFDYSDTQDDVAILGEFRIGLIMQLSERFRANAGYRALGVGGVALADDQIPLNATDPGLLSRSQTNGSLLLHGFYFGSEACF